MNHRLYFSPILSSDLKEIAKLQPEFWGNIIPTFEWYLTIDFAYMVKVTLENEIVGCGVVLRHENSAWLANIIVHRNHRNKGIGHAITEHLLEHAQKQATPVYLIATKLGRPVYSKLGFKPDEEYVFFNAHQLNIPVSTNIKPYDEHFKDAIYAMDLACTGEKRTRLLEPKIKDALLYIDEGKMEGFCIPTLGEGLTFAYTERAGLALLTVRLQEEKRVALPKSNQVAINFLLQHGFSLDENLFGVRMYLNNKPNWKPKFQYGRVGGNMG